MDLPDFAPRVTNAPGEEGVGGIAENADHPLGADMARIFENGFVGVPIRADLEPEADHQRHDEERELKAERPAPAGFGAIRLEQSSDRE